jgi:ABC-type multidrug transport system ATPase subunit
LDANFKKIFWKMLKTKKMKDNLTIVVTTSNREEAEFLGDRFFLIGRNKTVVYF